MDGAAASTSKSICGWARHSALNVIPPWSTLFLHIYLVTAVADWEWRVYPAAVGIALLLTLDFQLCTAGVSRNVCNQFIMRKKLERLVHDPGLGCLVFQPCKWLGESSEAPLFGICQLYETVGVRGQYSPVCDAGTEWALGNRVGTHRSVCGVTGGQAAPQGPWAAGYRLEVHNALQLQMKSPCLCISIGVGCQKQHLAFWTD